MSMDTKIWTKAKELFMKYGIKSVSMDDLSRQLGISKKTLYQFVDNKNGLIRKVIRMHLESEKKEIDAISKESKDAIHEMLMIARHTSIKLREANPSTMYDLQKYYPDSWLEFQSLHEEYVFEVIKNNIIKGIDSGIYRDNIQPDIIAKFYVGKSFILVDDKVFPSSTYRVEELFNEFFSYHIHGIASQKGLELLEKHLKEKEVL